MEPTILRKSNKGAKAGERKLTVRAKGRDRDNAGKETSLRMHDALIRKTEFKTERAQAQREARLERRRGR